eukprot:15431993-Alexandrium_andersonii.AAC.1
MLGGEHAVAGSLRRASSECQRRAFLPRCVQRSHRPHLETASPNLACKPASKCNSRPGRVAGWSNVSMIEGL